MLSIGICDDDIHMLTYLEKLCQKILPECKVTSYQTGSELLKSQAAFDIILMDIKMEGKMGWRQSGNYVTIPLLIFHAVRQLFLLPLMMNMYLRLLTFLLFSIF